MVHAVIDASVIASWFLPDETSGKYDDILDHIDKTRIHVPSVFEHEFMNILLNAQKRKRLDNTTTYKIFETVSHYPIVIEPSTAVFIENIKVFDLAQAHDLTAYDAAYLELALRLNLPLITYDKPLLNAAKQLNLAPFGRTYFKISLVMDSRFRGNDKKEIPMQLN